MLATFKIDLCFFVLILSSLMRLRSFCLVQMRKGWKYRYLNAIETTKSVLRERCSLKLKKKQATQDGVAPSAPGIERFFKIKFAMLGRPEGPDQACTKNEQGSQFNRKRFPISPFIRPQIRLPGSQLFLVSHTLVGSLSWALFSSWLDRCGYTSHGSSSHLKSISRQVNRSSFAPAWLKSRAHPHFASGIPCFSLSISWQHAPVLTRTAQCLHPFDKEWNQWAASRKFVPRHKKNTFSACNWIKMHKSNFPWYYRPTTVE